MISGNSFKIKVPASTANLGPGFDSIGLALNLYLEIMVEKSERWQVIPLSKELEVFQNDESHFIISVAKQVAKKYYKTLPPCRLSIKSEIPLARGLGSSASAIVAGIELADVLGALNLTSQQKLDIAIDFEDHPDNIGASLYGGLVIGSKNDDHTEIVSIHDLPVEIVVMIPKEELLTKESRAVLPDSFSFEVAVRAGSISNVFIAALLSQEWNKAGRMMRKDQYHQPFRKRLITDYDQIEGLAYKAGAFGVALSGAGPSIIGLVEAGKGKEVADNLSLVLPKMNVLCLSIDKAGSLVEPTASIPYIRKAL
ncbi:homoserine kinase [Bacillus pakistanensis]|uniref:Homoserine kinase n=1 Tax=Rossellomorea pakistanensis TaxID=992288 RepID=A0ABS2NJ13_9BACI|nr:homoserine kinase [Bacillus pakistanensis]MBM7587847.1 homoserine kinase [Bacillus pakistanensis]